MGQAISGKGFFYLDFEEGGEEDGEASNVAVLSFGGLPLSAHDPEAELHHLIGIDWDWKVTQVAAKEYMVLFPSQDCLRMSARSGKLFFPLSNSTAKIKLADADPAPVELLQEVWVTISGLPRRMWRAKMLMKGMRMLGRPVEVDLSSLARRTPVTIQIACRNPSKIHGLVQVFHKNGRFNVGIRVEQPPASSSVPPPALCAMMMMIAWGTRMIRTAWGMRRSGAACERMKRGRMRPRRSRSRRGIARSQNQRTRSRRLIVS
jgi:hypothetical protein